LSRNRATVCSSYRQGVALRPAPPTSNTGETAENCAQRVKSAGLGAPGPPPLNPPVSVPHTGWPDSHEFAPRRTDSRSPSYVARASPPQTPFTMVGVPVYPPRHRVVNWSP
jgi:hypothetical protein